MGPADMGEEGRYGGGSEGGVKGGGGVAWRAGMGVGRCGEGVGGWWCTDCATVQYVRYGLVLYCTGLPTRTGAKWRVACGEWRVASGEWPVGGTNLLRSFGCGVGAPASRASPGGRAAAGDRAADSHVRLPCSSCWDCEQGGSSTEGTAGLGREGVGGERE